MVLHYPRTLRPKHRDLVARWYLAVHALLFPSSGATFFSEPLPLFSAFPCTSTSAQRYSDSGPTD